MKKTPATTKTIEKIEALAIEVAENQDKYPKLYEEVQKLVDKGKIPLDHVVGYMMENTENVDALLAVRQACEEVIAEVYFATEENEVYQATLFAIPMMYIQSADHQITQLNGNSADFKKLTKSLKKSGLFLDESICYVDNHLYHPQELLNLSFDNVFSMNKAMIDKAVNIKGEDFKFNLVQEVRPENGNDTFTLKYMVGVKIIHESLVEEQYECFNEENFEKFVNLSQPLLSKMLKSEDVTVLGVERFFEALQLGLDAYLSNSRQIQILHHLESNSIHPHGAKAIITIPRESSEDSNIELVSKLTGESFAEFEFEIINCSNPEALMDSLAGDLEDCGIKTEDIYIRMDDNLVPFVTMLKHQTEAEKELNAFNVNVSANTFVVPSGKKNTFH